MLDIIMLTVWQYMSAFHLGEICVTVLSAAIAAISCYAPKYIAVSQRPKVRRSHVIPVIRAMPLPSSALLPVSAALAGLPFFSSHIGNQQLRLNWRRPQPIAFRY